MSSEIYELLNAFEGAVIFNSPTLNTLDTFKDLDGSDDGGNYSKLTDAVTGSYLPYTNLLFPAHPPVALSP